MDYISSSDQKQHETIATFIIHERKMIAQHYVKIKQFQERLLRIGTEDEQAAKRLTLSSIIADYG